MAKAMVLFFDSNNEARLMKKKVEEGCILIEDKQFIVDTAHPLLVKGLFGYKPLYILKWNNTTPADNINSNSFEREDPEFKEKYDITPEMLRKMMGLKILGNMIKVKKGSPGIIFLLVGAIAGFLILYSLILMKIIPI